MYPNVSVRYNRCTSLFLQIFPLYWYLVDFVGIFVWICCCRCCSYGNKMNEFKWEKKIIQIVRDNVWWWCLVLAIKWIVHSINSQLIFLSFANALTSSTEQTNNGFEMENCIQHQWASQTQQIGYTYNACKIWKCIEQKSNNTQVLKTEQVNGWKKEKKCEYSSYKRALHRVELNEIEMQKRHSTNKITKWTAKQNKTNERRRRQRPYTNKTRNHLTTDFDLNAHRTSHCFERRKIIVGDKWLKKNFCVHV